jgi:soluble lytic murein transglycosylase-like protein
VRIVLSILLTALAASMTAWAGEYAVLGNGFRIHADSHETEGQIVRLQTNQGVIELQAAAIARFESEDYTPPPPETPPTAPPASPAISPQELITRAAILAGLPPEIVHSIARAESGYRIDAVSPKGAVGLMQLMPGTAAGLNADPHDPEQNAQAGAQYLRELLLKYQNDPHQVSKAVAAYNAGPAAVDKYNGIPPYRETVDYVSRVLKEYEKEQKKKAPTTD